MKLGILFKCEEASHICDKSQYEESGLIERLLMRMHQLICGVCREHSAMNSKLTEAIRKANLKTMPESKKRELQQQVQQEIAK